MIVCIVPQAVEGLLITGERNSAIRLGSYCEGLTSRVSTAGGVSTSAISKRLD
jgi:hypothetical protein